MARYHFHAHDYSSYVQDEEGQELPGLDTSRDMALRSARVIMGGDVRQGCLGFRGGIGVAEEAGRVMLTLPFPDAVSIRTGNLPRFDGWSGADEARAWPVSPP